MNKADMVVLGFLRRKPMYGYELIQWLKKHYLDEWAEIKMPSVYKAMQRLETQGCIDGKKLTEGNNPPRTVYKITERGEELFIKTLRHFTTFDLNSKNFWLAISFMNHGFTRTEFLEILKNRKEKIHYHIEQHSNMHKDPEKSKDWFHIPYYIKILMNMGERMHRYELEALDLLLEESQIEENHKYFIREDQ